MSVFKRYICCSHCGENKHKLVEVCPHCGHTSETIIIRKWVSDRDWFSPITWFDGHWEYPEEQNPNR